MLISTDQPLHESFNSHFTGMTLTKHRQLKKNPKMSQARLSLLMPQPMTHWLVQIMSHKASRPTISAWVTHQLQSHPTASTKTSTLTKRRQSAAMGTQGIRMKTLTWIASIKVSASKKTGKSGYVVYPCSFYANFGFTSILHILLVKVGFGGCRLSGGPDTYLNTTSDLLESFCMADLVY